MTAGPDNILRGKRLGASNIFVGAKDIFAGANVWVASNIYVGANDIFVGANDCGATFLV